jgi:hypothetical protein
MKPMVKAMIKDMGGKALMKHMEGEVMIKDMGKEIAAGVTPD